jgi:hypothetical protein
VVNHFKNGGNSTQGSYGGIEIKYGHKAKRRK